MSLQLKSQLNIFVGRETYYNENIKLLASEHSKIQFGSYCAIGPNLKIITVNHDWNYPCIQGTFYRRMFGTRHPGELNKAPTRERTKGNVVIGNDVWLGDDVTILSGVTIGDGCCIGTKSVVSKSLPPYSICGGIPCKVIKYRYSSEIIDYLLELKWWEWSEEKIKQNEHFFNTNLNEFSLNDLKKMFSNLSAETLTNAESRIKKKKSLISAWYNKKKKVK